MTSVNVSLGLLFVICAVGTSVFGTLIGPKVWQDYEETAEYWSEIAQNELEKALKTEVLNKNVAKNIILFIGDGMGMSTITAGRILKGQMKKQLGEEFVLEMDKFTHAGLSRTYSVDRQTSDSAATATAFLCGVKTMDATLGLVAKVRRGKCDTVEGNEVDSILINAHDAGKSTGIASTTHLVHATVAAPYAHTPDRDWYSDAEMPQEAKDQGCKDIAHQFFDNSDKITVALGGGRKYFRSIDHSDESGEGAGGRRDGMDFIQEWIDSAPTGENREYIWNRDQMDNLDVENTDRLWGMFTPKHMSYEFDRNATKEPSIQEMVEKAIQVLQKNDNGYFLLVESGRIDHAHHDSKAKLALHEMVAFDDAIAKAVNMTSDEDTLIIVTADHGHTMTIGGYSYRGNPVFGFAPVLTDIDPGDMKPATSILYGDGPGFIGNGTLAAIFKDPNAAVVREDPTTVDTEARDYLFQSAVPRQWESHTGEDVAILARGPMAHLFHGVHEQHYIAHLMRYASCLDENKTHCNSDENSTSDSDDDKEWVEFLGGDLSRTNALVVLYVEFVLVICLALLAIFLGILVLTKKRASYE